MAFDAAIVKEQGVTFTVVAVKTGTLSFPSKRDSAIQYFSRQFPSPIILMEQNSRGVPTYYGRKDIVRFLRNIHPSQIPWKRYS
ncbi:hypothetical protein ACH95_14175 [Bacillus glycinifermentans]|uniref:hypothetical protein n=1 Tax=Bacillus glycinifermentans TaxID=1664069 RepID=UPI00065456F2|nr:hypothetical protein [Bacillus glycinifermentans]KMM58275.1 hypothetical protein ACH95_14175 [Bacillus glycinifermentans]MEC0493694.1 hypothetical protein [Bacillus glycinifermentans]MEC0541961.1 hypothetical protein [Bacillus glycinifermentans]